MTLIFAHRGYSNAFPENTMKAFEEAEKAGADGIELDVQMTKDGELVVIHDEKVDRTTDGTGYVKDLTYGDLKKLNAGFKSKKLSEKPSIPRLEEVFEWMTTNNTICNVELKNGVFPYKGMEEKVIELINKFQFNKRIVISSFNHYSIVYSHRIAPEIETAPLLSQALYMPWVYAQSIKARGIHPKYTRGLEDVFKLAIKNGVSVRPYTVNNESALKRLISFDCSAVITDDPLKAIRIRSQFQ